MRSLFIILLLSIISAGSVVLAQQQPVYSQYTLDKYLVNPAIAGANGFTTFNFISRQQYVGFENSPRTFTLNAQTRLLEDSYILRRMKLRKNTTRKSRSGRVGLGGSIFNDRNGIVQRSGIQGTYAYHINFANQWQLSGGLSILGYQYSIDDRDVPLADPDDPLLLQGRNSFFIPDATTGVFATNGSLYGGLTLNDLLGSGLKIGREVYTNYETLRKYSFIAGYKIPVSSVVSVEPSLLITRYTNKHCT
jgi:type IX secretion system PorP/SprF family membrane protein